MSLTQRRRALSPARRPGLAPAWLVLTTILTVLLVNTDVFRAPRWLVAALAATGLVAALFNLRRQGGLRGRMFGLAVAIALLAAAAGWWAARA